MTIDPRRLRFLVAVARFGGALAASDELGVTPSAVSQQLARLEIEVGRELVRRTPAGLRLTEAGQWLVEAGEEIETTLSEAETRLRARADDPVGRVRIGGFYSVLAVLIPRLAGWRERFPRLAIEVVEGEQESLLRSFRGGDLDAVILEIDAGESTRALPRGVLEVPLLDEPWTLVVPTGTVTSGDPIDIPRLGLPWLGIDPSAAGADALVRVRRSVAEPSELVHAYVETRTAMSLVAAGEGMALVPSLALLGLDLSGVETLHVPGLGQRRIVLRRTRSQQADASLDTVVGLVHEALSDLSFDFDGRGA